MVYTDSLKIQAILTAPKHVDYTNLDFRYAEFPEGLKVVFFDENGNENEVLADYGILYNDTKLIDLKGNVQLKSFKGSKLNTSQLFGMLSQNGYLPRGHLNMKIQIIISMHSDWIQIKILLNSKQEI